MPRKQPEKKIRKNGRRARRPGGHYKNNMTTKLAVMGRLELKHVPCAVRTEFIVYCKQHGMSMSAAIRLFVEEWVYDDKPLPVYIQKPGVCSEQTLRPFLIPTFPHELKRRFKLYAAHYGLSMRQLLISRITDCLAGEYTIEGKQEKGRDYYIGLCNGRGQSRKKAYYEE